MTANSAALHAVPDPTGEPDLDGVQRLTGAAERLLSGHVPSLRWMFVSYMAKALRAAQPSPTEQRIVGGLLESAGLKSRPSPATTAAAATRIQELVQR